MIKPVSVVECVTGLLFWLITAVSAALLMAAGWALRSMTLLALGCAVIAIFIWTVKSKAKRTDG